MRTTERELQRVAPPRCYTARRPHVTALKLGHSRAHVSVPSPSLSLSFPLAESSCLSLSLRDSTMTQRTRCARWHDATLAETRITSELATVCETICENELLELATAENVAERKSAESLRSRIGPVTESSEVRGRARATTRGGRPKIHPCRAHAANAPSSFLHTRSAAISFARSVHLLVLLSLSSLLIYHPLHLSASRSIHPRLLSLSFPSFPRRLRLHCFARLFASRSCTFFHAYSLLALYFTCICFALIFFPCSLCYLLVHFLFSLLPHITLPFCSLFSAYLLPSFVLSHLSLLRFFQSLCFPFFSA